ncbi:MaoC/PaaZ C-terminal domain-containing protein [Serinicoccus kebangsaanensis]|uniref:MaoC/PaaZ C-terminal domain-containing protein n=1 Tax=Serinicoccus kebangsaanensis TaxID=2602069 RepID=UPI00124EDFD0|nr:MaoC/PaaZ C-terminal domain-containing protein [Serinicoccus kebangsaanensis]
MSVSPRPDTPDVPSDVEVELLTEAPSIAAAFATGVATGLRRPGARGELPGRRLVLTGVTQDVARLADFCRVTGGLIEDTVPATWLHVLTFPLQVRLMASRDFPFPMLGMVHVANEMRVHRPVRVDEELTLSSWAENLAPHRRGSTVDVVGEARVRDEVVWEGRSTYLVRGDTSPGTSAATEDPGAAEPVAGDRAGDDASPARQIALWRVPTDQGRAYARVAGDANPIHLSALSAKAFGFPRAIAHGMWTHAKVLAALQRRLPQRYEVTVAFAKPILLPSVIVLRGTGAPGPGSFAVTNRDASRVHLSMQVTDLG